MVEKMKPIKILIPIIGFGNAGGYRVLSELANHWIDIGFIVDFLVEKETGKPYFPTTANIIYYNKKKKIAGFFKLNNFLAMYSGMALAISYLKNEYDFILANHSLTTYPVLFSGKSKSIKAYYIQAYEPEYYSLRRGLKNKILQFLSWLSYKLPLEQITNAEIYIAYNEIYATKWFPPGVDKNIFNRRTDIPNLSSSLTIGIIGRIEKTKGTFYAIEAFKKLVDKYPEMHLKIAYGNIHEEWKSNRVSVVIPENDNELAEFYKTIDILIAPGIVQLGACHYPVIEAMCCGTPVITTGYYPANDQNSWLVPIKDSNSIIDAVDKIIHSDKTDIENRLNQAHMDTIPFHWEKVAKEFADEITRLVNLKNK